MSLSVLGSLTLMLLLFASILHLVALSLPAWVQFGVFVPYSLTRMAEEERAGGGGEEGRLEDESVSNVTSGSVDDEHGGAGGVVDLQGPLVFVSIGLGLWEWCHQFRQMNPECEKPGFVGGVEGMAVVTLFTLPLSFLFLAYSACLDTHCPRRRLLTRLTLISSAFSGILLLVAVATYGFLTRREISAMLLQIGDDTELHTLLGWAFGAEGVTCALACVAAFCLALHLCHSPKDAPKFQLVV